MTVLPDAQSEPKTVSAGPRARLILGLTVAALVFGLVVLPGLYSLAIYGLDYNAFVQGEILRHFTLVGLANAVVIILALRLEGRLDGKLATVLGRILLVHGVLAFVILITRQYYSNQAMLLSAAVSTVLGPLVMYLLHRTIRHRAALLGPAEALSLKLPIPFDRITDPNADLRPYDIVLTTGVVDMSPEWAQTLTRAMLLGKPVRHLAEYLEENDGMVSIEHFNLDHLPDVGLTGYRTGKRVFDILLVLASLPVTLPLLSIGMLAVLVSEGGPVFFVQSRIGLGGAKFDVFKLRTMRPTMTSDRDRVTDIGDSRITRVGYWLRRFRIDELPQLWNVFKGDMSIIGPRPEWTVLSDQYVSQFPEYAYRSLVRPGITGWAQVRGGYAADLAETRVKVAYDLFYIKNLSFALDLQILVRTVWTLVSGSGAR